MQIEMCFEYVTPQIVKRYKNVKYLINILYGEMITFWIY